MLKLLLLSFISVAIVYFCNGAKEAVKPNELQFRQGINLGNFVSGALFCIYVGIINAVNINTPGIIEQLGQALLDAGLCLNLNLENGVNELVTEMLFCIQNLVNGTIWQLSVVLARLEPILQNIELSVQCTENMVIYLCSEMCVAMPLLCLEIGDLNLFEFLLRPVMKIVCDLLQ
ncbi:hypothetical protein PPYR_00534 [Photinus pyralis]|uniref:Uncharacterized protein n=1 Tax=Photinus pyralis TaxID=7054 RepID=A0A5N4B1W6_PHOPY|nr:hypothetical protein PPYR_00534 [Photinus pyralis]